MDKEKDTEGRRNEKDIGRQQRSNGSDQESDRDRDAVAEGVLICNGKQDRIGQSIGQGERDVEEGIESKEADIYLEVEHSKAVFQVNNLEVLNKAGQSGSWQASAWLLERRCPEDFGNNRNKGEEVQRIQIVSDVKAEEDK